MLRGDRVVKDKQRRSNERAQRFWCLLAPAVVLLALCTSGLAQINGAASATSSTPSDGDFTNNPVSLAIVPFITWSALLVGIVAGTVLYVYWRRRIRPYALQIGAVVAVVLALSTQLGVKAVMLNAEQKDCLSAEFGDENTSEQAITCGASRERAANAFGLVSVYAESAEVGAERNRPISPQVLSLIDLGTLAITTLLGCVLIVMLFVRRTIAL